MSRAKITIDSVSSFINTQEEKYKNTEVVREGDYYVLKLYDYNIARKHASTGVVQISTQGWDTQLTQRRLNGRLLGVVVRFIDEMEVFKSMIQNGLIIGIGALFRQRAERL